MARLAEHVYIVLTIAFTVYSQLIMRWQVSELGTSPTDPWGKVLFVAPLFANPWVLSAIGSTFLAGVSWMLVMTRFELSYAFPFASLSYVLVMIAAFVLFHEQPTAGKVWGTLLIVAGLMVIANE